MITVKDVFYFSPVSDYLIDQIGLLLTTKNYGSNRISLGTDNPPDRISAFTKSTRMGYLKENIVRPGETGRFVFNLKAPNWTGVYEEYFSPVIENVTWLDGEGMKIIMQVKPQNLLSYK